MILPLKKMDRFIFRNLKDGLVKRVVISNNKRNGIMGVYVCYDIIQRNFFRDRGIKDVVYGIHPKTYKRFWVFVQTKEFDVAMKEWLSRKV